MKLIYCDESCHLEHDEAKTMLLGAMSCDEAYKRRICQDIRDIKVKHGLSTWAEIKWTGVSPSKIDFYIELIDYFAKQPELNFRAVVAKNKENLNHEKYNHGSHDTWYYKAYFYLLDGIVSYHEEYNIYIDIKDTHGGPRVSKLHNVLCNNMYDFRKEVIKGIYQIRSHESEILELTDLIMGAIGYYHNDRYGQQQSSKAKNAVVEELFKFYENEIRCGTYRNASPKMNIFIWRLTK